jgi:hypothetical protein
LVYNFNKGEDSMFVGCKLPHGLILDDPFNPAVKIVLNGRNKARIIGGQYGVTQVDDEAFNAWLSMNPGYQPVVSGAIFHAKNENDLVAKARELERVETGFEPMPIDALGVKPADKD